MSKIIFCLKSALKQFLINFAGCLPILLMLDHGFDIQIIRDFGHMKAVGFASCVVFYAVIYSRYIHNK